MKNGNCFKNLSKRKKAMLTFIICALFAWSLIMITTYGTTLERKARERTEIINNLNIKGHQNSSTIQFRYHERQVEAWHQVNLEYCPKQKNKINLKSLAKLKRKGKLRSIIIDKRKKVLFCLVPKVASGNWKRVFLVLTGNYSDITNISTAVAHQEYLITSLEDLPVQEISQIIQEYRSFIMVREPMERLLSAYFNKIVQDYTGKFQRLFGAKIITYTKDKTYIKKHKKWNITFQEFVRFLTNEPESEAFEYHWERISNLCHPCLFNFDYVGRYGNMARDADRIVRMIDPKIEAHFPDYQIKRVKSTQSKMIEHFKSINRNELNKLLQLYKDDYQLFDLDKPKYLFNVVQN